jgi:opacity protein-like surface antigen
MNHKEAIASCALLVATCMPVHVHAQPYVGASLGQSRVDLVCTSDMNCAQHGTAFKLLVGYRVAPNAAVEAMAYDQGKATLTNTRLAGDLRSRGVGTHLLLIAPLGERASLTGKIGLVATRISMDGNSSASASTRDSEWRIHTGWGVGGGYEFTQHIGARLEFERVHARFHDEKLVIDLMTAGLVYRF